MWQLPTFLFVASVANAVFLFYAIRDHATSNDPAATRALLAIAAAELVWVLPCFLQCFITLISDGGNEWWVAAHNDTGCDMMGWYSIFASVSGQLLVTQLAYITHSVLVRKERVPPTHVSLASGMSFLVAFLVAMLPAFGAGEFAYSGEGFCYIDWSNTGQVVAMELVTWPTFIATSYFYIACALCSDSESSDSCVREPSPPPRHWWWVFLLAYTTAWVLWIPAGFIGLGSDRPYPDMFPQGYMIAGAVLGHLQALINPLLYGYKWRSWFMGVQVTKLESIDTASTSTPQVSPSPQDGDSGLIQGRGAKGEGHFEDMVHSGPDHSV